MNFLKIFLEIQVFYPGIVRGVHTTFNLFILNFITSQYAKNAITPHYLKPNICFI